MPWEPAPGVMLGGKYRLERALADGGMGSVWVARHTRLDADVAVKLMGREIGQNPSSVARFEREAKACAQLPSPHVVAVHDFGVEDGTPYMVMELLRGEDLGDRIDRIGRMTLPEAVAIAVPIGKALRVAHDAGIVHRDLKPRNVFLARQGDDEVVKLVDFGIARETKTKLVDERTQSGVVMGSPYHMAPEQAQALAVDHRADLWAFGVVLYRLVTGYRPFDGDNVTSVLMTICMTAHAAPSQVAPGLPPAVDAFFAKALAKDPARRFQTARELVDAFVAAVESAEREGTGASAPALAEPNPAFREPSQPMMGAASTPASGGPSFAEAPSLPEAPPVASAPIGPAPNAPHDPLSQSASIEARTPAPSLRDASASHALRAVSAGSFAAPQGRSRMGVWVAAGVALVAAGVVVVFALPSGPARPAASSLAGRSSAASPAGDAPSSTTSARAESAPPPSSLSPSAVPPAVEVGSAAPSAPPAVSSSAPVSAPPRGSQRPPPPAAPPRTPPPATPAIDPFTGLPVAPR